MDLPHLDRSQLLQDIYFNPEFIRLHAQDGAECLSDNGFFHGAALVPIVGSDRFDLHTAWGYGGPVAESHLQLVAGMKAWCELQSAKRRVAEFVRLHPFVDLTGIVHLFEMHQLNRTTVFVDLSIAPAKRFSDYSPATRNCLRKAAKAVRICRVGSKDAATVKSLYEEGLTRNRASEDYGLKEKYFQELLNSDWATCFMAFDGDAAVCASIFLHSTPALCHYHLSGGTNRQRQTFANYLILEHAFGYFADLGYAYMHLGGGRTPAHEDTLLAFKAKFSRLRTDYYIAGLVHDRAAYIRLGGGKERFLCSGRS
jgi:hypothetical protein